MSKEKKRIKKLYQRETLISHIRFSILPHMNVGWNSINAVMLDGRTKGKGEGNTFFFSANVSKWKDEVDPGQINWQMSVEYPFMRLMRGRMRKEDNKDKKESPLSSQTPDRVTAHWMEWAMPRFPYENVLRETTLDRDSSSPPRRTKKKKKKEQQ